MMISTQGSRVEEVPGAITEPHEFLLLAELAAGAITALAEGTASRCGRAMAERRAGTVLVLGAVAALASAVRVAARHAGSLGRRGRRGLVSAVVDQLGEELGAAAGELNLCIFSRPVLSRPATSTSAGGGQRGSRGGMGRVSGLSGSAITVGADALEDIGDRRQTVHRLVRRDVVDVGGVGEVGGLVGDVPGERMRLVTAGEGLIKRSGLDHAFMGELLVGWGYDAQSWRGLPP